MPKRWRNSPDLGSLKAEQLIASRWKVYASRGFESWSLHAVYSATESTLQHPSGRLIVAQCCTLQCGAVRGSAARGGAASTQHGPAASWYVSHGMSCRSPDMGMGMSMDMDMGREGPVS